MPLSFSPSGKKFRSKPQLSRYLGNTVDLGCFDFRTGKMMPGKMQKNKQRLRHDPLSLAKVTLMDHICGGELWLCCGCVLCYKIMRLTQQKFYRSAGQFKYSLKRKRVICTWNPAHRLLNFCQSRSTFIIYLTVYTVYRGNSYSCLICVVSFLRGLRLILTCLQFDSEMFHCFWCFDTDLSWFRELLAHSVSFVVLSWQFSVDCLWFVLLVFWIKLVSGSLTFYRDLFTVGVCGLDYSADKYCICFENYL